MALVNRYCRHAKLSKRKSRPAPVPAARFGQRRTPSQRPSRSWGRGCPVRSARGDHRFHSDRTPYGLARPLRRV